MTYIHLLQGGEYTHEEIASWLKEAGFVRPRRVNLFKAPGTSLIIGTCA